MRWEEALKWQAEESKGAELTLRTSAPRAPRRRGRRPWYRIRFARRCRRFEARPGAGICRGANRARFRLHQGFLRQRAALRGHVKRDARGNREGGTSRATRW